MDRSQLVDYCCTVIQLRLLVNVSGFYYIQTPQNQHLQCMLACTELCTECDIYYLALLVTFVVSLHVFVCVLDVTACRIQPSCELCQQDQSKSLCVLIMFHLAFNGFNRIDSKISQISTSLSWKFFILTKRSKE